MRVCLMLLVASLAVSSEAHASCPDPGHTRPECLEPRLPEELPDADQARILRSAQDEAGERASLSTVRAREAGATMASIQAGVVADGSTGHGIGLTAGMTSGLGLAYRRFISPAHGVHVGGIGFAEESRRHVNLGVEYLRTIHRRGASRLYWLVGGSVYYNQHQTVTFPGCEPGPDRPGGMGRCDFESPVRGWTGESLYSIGPGLGFEWNPGAMGISLELPLPLRYRQDREGFRFDSFLPVPNVSIVYYLPGGR